MAASRPPWATPAGSHRPNPAGTVKIRFSIRAVSVPPRTHTNSRRSRWRRLDPGRQALLTLAHLCNGDTYTRLAAGFGTGATHDLSAARVHGIIDALSNADVMTFADKGHQGACGRVRTPFKRHRYRPKLFQSWLKQRPSIFMASQPCTRLSGARAGLHGAECHLGVACRRSFQQGFWLVA